MNKVKSPQKEGFRLPNLTELYTSKDFAPCLVTVKFDHKESGQ